MESTSSSAGPRVQVSQASAITPNQQPRAASDRALRFSSRTSAARRLLAWMPAEHESGTRPEGVTGLADRQQQDAAPAYPARAVAGAEVGLTAAADDLRADDVDAGALLFVAGEAEVCWRAPELRQSAGPAAGYRIVRRMQHPSGAEPPHLRLVRSGHVSSPSEMPAGRAKRKRRASSDRVSWHVLKGAQASTQLFDK
jgi:hypothetical protein